jgi:hypothetical protein
MTAADKIATNTTILVLSRLAMLATPILLTAVGGIFWLYLDSIAADASTAVDTSDRLSTRAPFWRAHRPSAARIASGIRTRYWPSW